MPRPKFSMSSNSLLLSSSIMSSVTVSKSSPAIYSQVNVSRFLPPRLYLPLLSFPYSFLCFPIHPILLPVKYNYHNSFCYLPDLFVLIVTPFIHGTNITCLLLRVIYIMPHYTKVVLVVIFNIPVFYPWFASLFIYVNP